MPPRVTLPPTDADARTIRRSRVASFLLLTAAAVVFSLRPEVFGDPQGAPWHAVLHVWRIVVGIVLVVAALGVQVAVGVRWRRGLRRRAEGDADGPATPPGNQSPTDR